MVEQKRYVTIPDLAARLRITPVAVRDWIVRGLVEDPPRLPVTRIRAWSKRDAERIERWFLARRSKRQPST